MTVIIDQVRTHDGSNTGDETTPTGITGLDWCHLVSGAGLGEPPGTGSLLELTTFLTTNLLTIGCAPTNVRTPLLGSVSTYAGLTAAQRTAAITAGAVPNRQVYVETKGFDSVATSPHYEP